MCVHSLDSFHGAENTTRTLRHEIIFFMLCDGLWRYGITFTLFSSGLCTFVLPFKLDTEAVCNRLKHWCQKTLCRKPYESGGQCVPGLRGHNFSAVHCRNVMWLCLISDGSEVLHSPHMGEVLGSNLRTAGHPLVSLMGTGVPGQVRTFERITHAWKAAFTLARGFRPLSIWWGPGLLQHRIAEGRKSLAACPTTGGYWVECATLLWKSPCAFVCLGGAGHLLRK